MDPTEPNPGPRCALTDTRGPGRVSTSAPPAPDDEDMYHRMRRVVAGRDERARTGYAGLSARRLAAAVERKMATALIGALARFERHFGGLWGHGRPPSLLTPDQLAWKAAWERCRQEVLDHGNGQARGAAKELTEYDVVWRRHTLTLPAK